MHFGISNRSGMTHKCDGQTDLLLAIVHVGCSLPTCTNSNNT